MRDSVFVGQDADFVIPILKPDGSAHDLAGHTADVVFIKPDKTSTITKTGVTVDTVAGTVTASLVPAELVTGDRGIWRYYPIIKAGGKEWPGSANHFHLVARG